MDIREHYMYHGFTSSRINRNKKPSSITERQYKECLQDKLPQYKCVPYKRKQLRME